MVGVRRSTRCTRHPQGGGGSIEVDTDDDEGELVSENDRDFEAPVETT